LFNNQAKRNTIMARQLASLATEAEPDYITIDGQRYAVVSIDSLSAVQAAAMQAQAKRLAAFAKEDLSEEEAREADATIDGVVKRIMPGLDDAALARLGMRQKVEIANAFFLRAQELARAQNPNGSTPSPDASDSTETAPTHG
jgi:hypothetical protein